MASFGSQFQISNPIPQWLQILIVDRQSTNVFIELDCIAKTLFRLFHATSDTRVERQVERDYRNLGMHRLRPQQNGFRLMPWSLAESAMACAWLPEEYAMTPAARCPGENWAMAL
jgi:hypothetical protein